MQIFAARAKCCIRSCHRRLATLIQQELAERGQLDQFMDRLCILEDNQAHAEFCLPRPQAFQSAPATSLPDSVNTSPPISGPESTVAQQPQAVSPQTSVALAQPADRGFSASTSIVSPATEQCQQIVVSTGSNMRVTEDTAGPSVLDAAIAAYKQEMRQLWKVLSFLLTALGQCAQTTCHTTLPATSVT